MKKIGFVISVLTVVVLSSFYKFENKKYAPKEKFKVIRVNGKILFVKTGSEMKRGDVYVNGTPLDFANVTAKAAIINPNKGRFVLQANQKGKVKVLPATSNVTSRAGALINLIDLQNHFKDRYLIFDEEQLTIGSEAFPMDEEHFFYLKYDYNGESIAKVLPFEDNKLILNKTEIFKIDGKPIPVEEKEMALFYRNELDKKSYKISNFTPVFPELNILKDEVEIMLGNLNKKETAEAKISEITSYLNEFYGKPQKQSLYDWLEKEFDLKVEQDIKFK
ncbi:MAG: hypothetical protein ACWA41_11585 [Putridiphycobacter sp.]